MKWIQPASLHRKEKKEELCCDHRHYIYICVYNVYSRNSTLLSFFLELRCDQRPTLFSFFLFKLNIHILFDIYGYYHHYYWKVGRYLCVEYRNNVRLSQVNAKSYLNLFRLIFYEVKTSLRSRTGTRKNGRQNISIMLLWIYSIDHMTTKHRS